MKVSLVLACAGKGERAGFDKNKLLYEAGGQTVLQKTLSSFLKSGVIDDYVISVSEADFDFISSVLPEGKIVLGGNTRSQSVKNALKEVCGDVVLIHDGARPFITEKIIRDCLEAAKEFGGAVTAVPSRDTIAKGGRFITEYEGKEGYYIIQTPQAFKTELIKKAYDLAGDKIFNDDGEVYKTYIGDPVIVKGDYDNVKLTYEKDFNLLNSYGNVKVGTGFDCHKLVTGRKLILGGVTIPHDKGLLGHSDADVLTHAVMDALLSALSLRDIGYHFPDSDPEYKNADSMLLLKKVTDMIKSRGYKIINLSAVIMAEKPKLSRFIPKITEKLAAALSIEKENVGLTATTLEGLGFVGREEGICVSANVSLISN